MMLHPLFRTFLFRDGKDLRLLVFGCGCGRENRRSIHNNLLVLLESETGKRLFELLGRGRPKHLPRLPLLWSHLKCRAWRHCKWGSVDIVVREWWIEVGRAGTGRAGAGRVVVARNGTQDLEKFIIMRGWGGVCAGRGCGCRVPKNPALHSGYSSTNQSLFHWSITEAATAMPAMLFATGL